jgi:AcrR family transcriptional regulator
LSKAKSEPAHADEPAEPSKPSAARSRILLTADRPFYADGIRAVGVDRVVAESQVTRVTFYRHFPSKDDLIVAYLAARSWRERQRLETIRAAHPGDPRAVLGAVVAVVVEESRSPGFRGSPYVNAAAEYSDLEHPVRRIVAEHRAWFHGAMAALLEEIGHPRVDAASDQLVMLYDGAMIGGHLDDPDRIGHALVEAGRAVIDHRG